MTTSTAFWRDPAFAAFVPHIRATPAWDKRHGEHPRFDLKSSTPRQIELDALAFTGPCCRCGRRINVFRVRDTSGGGIYLAAACELSVRIGCSRGNHATRAYDAIWQMIKDEERRHGEQGGLL